MVQGTWRITVSGSPERGYITRRSDTGEVLNYWGKAKEIYGVAQTQETSKAPEKVENDPPRKTATAADIAELAAKYRPTRMSQREYDSFLEDLADKGILNQNDLEVLGYRGLTVIGRMSDEYFTENHGSNVYDFDASAWRGPMTSALFAGSMVSLEAVYGNVLTMTRIKSAWKPNPCCTNPYTYRAYDTNQAMVEVLERMQSVGGR